LKAQRLQFWICVISFLLIAMINLLGSMRPLYKGVRHPVGSDVVNVYAGEEGSNIPVVPVKQYQQGSGGYVDTGSKVRVYLRNTYKDDQIVWYPRVTLGVLGVAGILILLTLIMKTYIKD
jgi:hypothetical protein